MDGQKILLVEDDRFQRGSLEARLRREGYRVEVAEDGQQALRMLAGGDHPDLVLLDLIMPKVQGFEVLRVLKSDPGTAAIPVIVLTNLGQASDIEQARAGGAVDYIVKARATLRDVVARVEAALAAV